MALRGEDRETQRKKMTKEGRSTSHKLGKIKIGGSNEKGF